MAKVVKNKHWWLVNKKKKLEETKKPNYFTIYKIKTTQILQ